ncbi:MAG: YdeI/OmpD-associated family protein [Chloroflexota bacterium]
MSKIPQSEDHTVPMDFFKHLHANPTALAVYSRLTTEDKRAHVAYIDEVNDRRSRKERIDEIIVRLMVASAS